MSWPGKECDRILLGMQAHSFPERGSLAPDFTTGRANHSIAAGASHTSAPRPVAIRPLVMPVEHGGWSLLLEPIVLALIILPSAAGALVAFAAVCAFLIRQPLNLAVQDHRRERRFPRTIVCERLVLFLASAVVVTLLWPVLETGGGVLMPMLLASPLLGVLVAHDLRSPGRALVPEIAAATMVGAAGAAVIFAGHGPASVAYALWAVMACRAIPAIMHVRTSLGKSSFAASVLVHVAAVLVTAALYRGGVLPAAAVVAMLLLYGRALFAVQLRRLSAKRMGITELAMGMLTVAIVAIGFLK